MIKRKATKKYYFTVEGETEKWYLDWLKDRINECAKSDYKVSFDAQVQKNPLKRAKSLAVTGKTEINGAQTHRKNYINALNRAYDEKFESMDEYKHEDNFKRCLGKLSLDNVRSAVARADAIMERNLDIGYRLCEYKGYKYYKENPSLTINEIVGKILEDCGLSCSR